VELLVTRQASLHGVVTRNHRPVAGARVGVTLSVQEFAATSDAQGRYLLEGLPRGTFHLVASSDTAGAFVELPGLTLKADEDRELDLELVSASSIEGTVVDERGAPLSGALVVFTNEAKDDEGRDTTSADGHFRCTQMLGGSAYTPEVFLSGRPGVAAKPVGALPSVMVRDGDAHVEGVRLQVKVEKLPLAGRVVDASGAPVPDAKVRAQSVEPGERAVFSAWQPLAQAFSDAQGRFSFEGLSSGSWAVQARSPQGDEVVVEARAGSTDVVLTLRTAARIEGKLVDFSQPPSVYAQQPGVPLVPGQVRGDSFSLTLPAGTWTLSAMDNQEGDAQRVTLAEGEVKWVVMTSRGTGKVRGRVVDRSSCCTTRRSPTSATCCRCWSKSPRPASPC
jgi:protocatechuate 3,4-dioxygenase beta subunit